MDKISCPHIYHIESRVDSIQSLFDEGDFYLIKMAAMPHRAWRGNRSDVRRLAHLIIALTDKLQEERWFNKTLQERLEALGGALVEYDNDDRYGVGMIRDHNGDKKWVMYHLPDKIEQIMAGTDHPRKIPKMVMVTLKAVGELFNEGCQRAYDMGFKDGTDVLRTASENHALWQISRKKEEAQ